MLPLLLGRRRAGLRLGDAGHPHPADAIDAGLRIQRYALVARGDGIARYGLRLPWPLRSSEQAVRVSADLYGTLVDGPHAVLRDLRRHLAATLDEARG